MKDAKEAGALIIRHLAVMEEAERVAGEVQEEVFKAVDEAVEAFAKRNGWTGGVFDFLDDECWLTIPAWTTTGDPDETLAWFSVNADEGGEDYFLTSLCGAGTDRLGLKFHTDASQLGGKKSWKTYARAANQRYPELEADGWIFQEDSWFRAFKIDADTLAKAYLEDDIESALGPLNEALEKLAAAAPTFEIIVAEAKAAAAKQAG